MPVINAIRATIPERIIVWYLYACSQSENPLLTTIPKVAISKITADMCNKSICVGKRKSDIPTRKRKSLLS